MRVVPPFEEVEDGELGLDLGREPAAVEELAKTLVVFCRRGQVPHHAMQSLPEVVGTAGVLLDPGDVSAWAAAIERLADDSPWATDLANAALDRARTFSWEQSAIELRRAYQDAVRRRRER